MNTIKKLSITFLFVALLLVFSSSEVFAGTFGKDKEDLGHSPEYMMIGGEKYYLWRDTKHGYRVWLWMLEQDLGEFVQIEDNLMRKGKNHICRPIYFPVDNKGNPYNYALLKTEEAAKEMFKISANTAAPTNLDLRYEKPVSQGGMGKAYTTTYPSLPETATKVGEKNYHFKIEFYDAIYKRFRDYGRKFFLYQGQEGNFRSGLSRNDATMHNPWFPAGYFSNEKQNKDWSFAGRIFVDTDTLKDYIPEGEYTKEYKMGLVSDVQMIQDFASYVAVYPELIAEMQKRTKNYGDFYTDYSSAIDNSREFFEISNQYNPPAKGLSGQATLAFTWKSGGVWKRSWASLNVPVSSFENNITVYDMQLIDPNTGLEFEYEDVEDINKGLIKDYGLPRGTETVTVKWAQGLEDGALETIDVESLNSNIKSNLYAESLSGEFVELAAKQEGTIRGKMKGFLSYNWDKFYELMRDTGIYEFDALNDLYPNQILVLDESRLNWYQVDVPIEKLSEKGYITSNTPWQYKHYKDFYFDEKMIIQVFADNVNESPVDDMLSVHYHTAEPKQKDIKISNVEGLGTWDESLGKFIVNAGATYDVKVSVINNGALDTERENPVITWGTSEFDMTAQVRANNTNKTNPMNPKILAFESTETLDYTLRVTVPNDAENDQEFNFGVAIHVGEDDYDNAFVLNDDFRSIETIVKSDVGNADIGIKDIILKSGSTTYNTIDASGTYKFDPNVQNYTMEIIVEKFAGDAPVSNPQVELVWQVDADSPNSFNPTVTVPGTLTNVGQTLSYNQNVYAYEQYLYFKASINNTYHLNTNPKTNIENDNDTKEKTYGSGQDFQVSDVIVSPEKLYIPTGDTTIQSGGTVTAKINTVSYGTGTFENVQVTLTSPVLNETKTIDLSTGIDYISFNLPDRSYSVGDYAFKVTVNGNRAYKEATYDNNVGNATLQVKSTIDNIPSYCNGTYTYTTNTWERRHTIVERNKNWTVCCSKYGGCWRCCKGSTRYFNANPYPKTYTERLDLSTYGASNKTNWGWERGSIEVNAGRAFEIKWELTYYTNRNQYPRTEDRYDDGQCGGDYTRPTYSAYYFNTPLYIEISGYNFPQFSNHKVLYGSYSGSWYNRKVLYQINMQTDALGDTSRKLYTDLNTSDRTITFKSWSDHVRGYALTFNESTGQNEPLLDCDVFTVKVKDAIDINKKTIE